MAMSTPSRCQRPRLVTFGKLHYPVFVIARLHIGATGAIPDTRPIVADQQPSSCADGLRLFHLADQVGKLG
jgi:hypothetical protein